jgi:hypothetical protein
MDTKPVPRKHIIAGGPELHFPKKPEKSAAWLELSLAQNGSPVTIVVLQHYGRKQESHGWQHINFPRTCLGGFIDWQDFCTNVLLSGC